MSLASLDAESSERLARARVCAERGQWPEAEQLYREVIGQQPDQVDALEGLGLAALASKRPAEALEWLERARERAPRSARIIGNLGLALRHNGQLERAIVRYEEAFALDPTETSVLVNRARAEREAGRLSAAIESFRRAAALRPKTAGIWSMLSNVLREAQRYPEALEAARHALELDPWFFEAHLNEGTVLHAMGNLADATTSYLVATSHPPLRPAALANLAAALRTPRVESLLAAPALALARRLLAAATNPRGAPLAGDDAASLVELARDQTRRGRSVTAIGCFEWARKIAPSAAAERELSELLWQLGHDRTALDRLFCALSREPGEARNYRLLGVFLSKRGSIRSELARWSRALASCPEDTEALIRLGAAAQRLGRPSEAAELYRRLVRLAPDLAAGHFYLGSALTKQGKFREAQPAYRRALELEPGRLVSHSNLLFTLHFDPELSREAIFEEHCAFGKCLEAVESARVRVHAITPGDAERRLRVGYVSPDLCAHPVAHFMEPVLREHDANDIEVYCYSDAPHPDAVTERLSRLAPHFAACAGWSHDALFERITGDRIDILVDLAGHTAKSRLPVFARKPSPVQVSWLGYFDTTGLSTIDYRIADAHSVSADDERFFVERIVRLPRSANCYLPPEAPAPPPAPCLARGQVRFGYFNNPTKLGRQVVAAFGRILHALPDSRMLLKYRAFDDPGYHSTILAWFAEERITAERIQFEGHSSMDRFLRTLTEVDIALDPFPYSGETTALHALWMGVPVVTLEGPALVQRLASRVLRVAGLNEWIARDEGEYVAIATALARDPERLGCMRAELRGRLQASSLLDHRGVTRELEAAYRRMWRARCASSSDDSAASES